MHLRSRLTSATIVASFVVSVFGAGLPHARATGNTYFVATDGADLGPNGQARPNSLATPWKSMRFAIRRMQAGDTVYVRGGTYTDWSVGWGAARGTSTAPLKIMNYQGERVILKGTMQFVHPDYWTIDGINVTRDPARGRSEFLVKIVGGRNWQFLHSEVWGGKIGRAHV